MAVRYIELEGASSHNLKSVSVKIPKESLVVITGRSGSGKSSLAFATAFCGWPATIYGVALFLRPSILDQVEKPEIDHIHGLTPTIAISQRRASYNPRSTVATATGSTITFDSFMHVVERRLVGM